MKTQEMLDLLTSWNDLLAEFAAVEIDVTVPTDELTAAFKKRQNAIEKIQDIDASLQEIAALRKNGWPGVAPTTRDRAEKLVTRALDLLNATSQKDGQLLKAVQNSRQEVLTNLRRSGLSKKYIETLKQGLVRPPIVIDRKA